MKHDLNVFLQIISAEMVDKIVKYTNIFINKKRFGRGATSTTVVRARDYRGNNKGRNFRPIWRFVIDGPKKGKSSRSYRIFQ